MNNKLSDFQFDDAPSLDSQTVFDKPKKFKVESPRIAKAFLYVDPEQLSNIRERINDCINDLSLYYKNQSIDVLSYSVVCEKLTSARDFISFIYELCQRKLSPQGKINELSRHLEPKLKEYIENNNPFNVL